MGLHDIISIIRRYFVLAAIAFWIGGFTFYASVVIPVGMQVLGSHRRQGFITQQVANWLNISSIFALAIFSWNAWAIWRRIGRVARTVLAVSLVAMAVIQIELFILHPYLDHLLNTKTQRIIDHDHFDSLHRVYLASTTIQWCFGLLHVLGIAAILKD